MPASIDSSHYILVVDDEPLHRRLISIMLSRAGYAIDTAKDGREALAKIRMHRPTAIILDLEMPELSGLELLAKMAQDPALKTIPTIVVSANADKPEARALLSRYYTFVDVIQKPFLKLHLLERVQHTQRPSNAIRNGVAHNHVAD